MPQQKNQQQQQPNLQQAGGRNSTADTDVNSRDNFTSSDSSQGRSSQSGSQSSQQWSQQETKEKGSGMNQAGQAGQTSRQAPGTDK